MQFKFFEFSSGNGPVFLLLALRQSMSTCIPFIISSLKRGE